MIYIPWNTHNPKPDVYNFDGMLDVVSFIKQAETVGLLVIVRATPYICAEYDLGGIPSWLLNVTDITLRSSDPKFMEPYLKFQKVLVPKLALQYNNGNGPIILMQIENEYGSYGSDTEYLEQLRSSFTENGIKNTQFFFSNGPNDNTFLGGSLPDELRTMNFPASDFPDKHVKWIKKKLPNQPAFVSEWWDGWFDFWGNRHSTTDGQKEAASLDWLLQNKVSVNMYMFIGGTNFGYTSGANSDGDDESTLSYKPITTSYDYNSALNESGDPTYKWTLFKNVISKYNNINSTLPPTPARVALGGGVVKMTSSILFDIEDEKTLNKLSIFKKENEKTVSPKNMEYFGQSDGFILYKTKVLGPQKGSMSLQEVHDRVQLYQDGVYLGAHYRNEKRTDVGFNVPESGSELTILAENMGRIGFGPFMSSEKKGLVGPVYVNGKQNYHWRSWSFDFSDISAQNFQDGLVYKNNPPHLLRRNLFRHNESRIIFVV